MKLSKPTHRNFTTRAAYEAAKAAYIVWHAAELSAYFAYLAARPLWKMLPATFEGGYITFDPRRHVRQPKEHAVLTCKRRHREVDHPLDVTVYGTVIRSRMDGAAVGQLRRAPPVPVGGVKDPKVIPTCTLWVNNLVLRPAVEQ